MTMWFHLDAQGRRRGPVGIDELIRALVAHANPRTVRVWREGLDDWQQAGEVSEVARKLPPEGPVVAGKDASGRPDQVPLHEVARIAALYRTLVALAGFMLAWGALGGATPSASTPWAVLQFIVLVGSLVAAGVATYRLLIAVGDEQALGWGFGASLPWVGIIVMGVASWKAHSWCVRHGVPVGILGPTRKGLNDLGARGEATDRSIQVAVAALAGILAVMLGLGLWMTRRPSVEKAAASVTPASPPAAAAPGRERSGTTPPKAGDVWENPKDGLRYRWVPPGSFLMGCASVAGCLATDLPAQVTTLARGIWLGETEVSIAALRIYDARARGTGGNPPPSDDHPAVANWGNASAFCNWAGGRLPTEVEWERGARGGQDGLIYPWGDVIDRTRANYGADQWDGSGDWNADGWGTTAPVGTFPANDYGLHDTAGNLAEWTSDGSGSRRWVRGGDFMLPPEMLRTSSRVLWSQHEDSIIGFRCALDGPRTE